MVKGPDLAFNRRSGSDRRSAIDRRRVNNFDHLFFSRVERRQHKNRRSYMERRSGWSRIGTIRRNFITGAGSIKNKGDTE